MPMLSYQGWPKTYTPTTTAAVYDLPSFLGGDQIAISNYGGSPLFYVLGDNTLSAGAVTSTGADQSLRVPPNTALVRAVAFSTTTKIAMVYPAGATAADVQLSSVKYQP